MSVIDIGCGVGGDIPKLFTARIKDCVSIDPSSENIYSGSNGYLSRYNTLKNKYPQFPHFDILVGDLSVKLNYID